MSFTKIVWVLFLADGQTYMTTLTGAFHNASKMNIQLMKEIVGCLTPRQQNSTHLAGVGSGRNINSFH
jgi:hypothetical protein